MLFGRQIITKRRHVAGAMLLAILGMAAGLQAQGIETAVIPPPDSGSGFFGRAVSLSADGQTALVGAPSQGRAYVFVHGGGGWALETRLPMVGPSGSGFGRVVAISADSTVALVASPDEQTCPGGLTFSCGAVYIFVRTGGTWTLADKLIAPSFFDFEFNFGNALALSADGSTVLVGRGADDCVHQPCRGAVFAYERTGSTWGLVDTLKASNPSVQVFGADVSLTPDGSTAIIGAPLTSCGAFSTCGEAYVFTRSGADWSEQARLTFSDPTSFAVFGTAVGISADGLTALVGAPRSDSGPGSVYGFRRSGGSWVQVQKVTAGGSGDQFGNSLDLAADGRSALVGAPFADCSAGADCGAVYRLMRLPSGLWTSPAPLSAFPAGALSGFSVALSADGGTGLAGAPGTSCSAGSNCGSVYAFSGLLATLDVPTVSGLGLVCLILLLGASGALLLKRRRPGF